MKDSSVNKGHSQNLQLVNRKNKHRTKELDSTWLNIHNWAKGYEFESYYVFLWSSVSNYVEHQPAQINHTKDHHPHGCKWFLKNLGYLSMNINYQHKQDYIILNLTTSTFTIIFFVQFMICGCRNSPLLKDRVAYWLVLLSVTENSVVQV